MLVSGHHMILVGSCRRVGVAMILGWSSEFTRISCDGKRASGACIFSGRVGKLCLTFGGKTVVHLQLERGSEANFVSRGPLFLPCFFCSLPADGTGRVSPRLIFIDESTRGWPSIVLCCFWFSLRAWCLFFDVNSSTYVCVCLLFNCVSVACFVCFVLTVPGGAPGRGCQREARTELQAGLLPRAEEGGCVSGC